MFTFCLVPPERLPNFLSKKGENIFKNPPFFFSFKEDVSDIRNSKVIDLIKELQDKNFGYAHPVLLGADIEKALSLRKAGLGLLGNIVGDRKAVACIEDTAVEVNDLPNYIKEFNKSEIPQGEKVTELVIDKYTYQANETIGVKDLGLIEKIYRGQDDNFCAQTLAILFKRTDLTRTEHYAPAHLKVKVALMKKQNQC